MKIASLSIAVALLAFDLSNAPAAAQPILSDLIVTNISISPANPASGEAVTFTATTKNQGTAATPSGVSIGVTFFIDGNPVSASDNNIISLAPGASVNLTANQAPRPGGSSTWIAAAGIHTVLAAADIPYIRITEINKSNNSLSNTITVTATPPAFAIGDRVKTTANLNVYATPSTSGTIVGAQSVGSFGNVIGGPISANGFVWWNIDYDVGATGWSVQHYQAKVNPIPTVTLVANPTSITPGGSSTLTWSSTNATSCTGTGFTAGGTSGIATVSPTTVPQTYSITCTGTGGTGAPATATITAAVPDLIVTNISISPADPASGEAVTFTATTKNQGTAATPSGVSIGVTFFIDGNPVSASDNNIISLAPGASVNLTANQAPGPGGSSTWIAAAGIHTVLAAADIPYIRITEINKSNNSLSNTITVTATPPAFAIGDRVKTTANLNVYATPSTSGTIVGAQSVGSFGNVIGGPISANGFVWWNIDYDVGATGWSVQHYQAKVNPIPTVTLVANPTSITPGGSSTLTWSSTNATSCTGTGFTAGGTSGIATVSPTTVPQTYSITCTGTGGTGAPATATITAAVPDLIVTNISMSPANPASGEAVTFTATTKNQGTAATPSGVSIGVTFFIDGNPVSASDNNIISLAPGASVNLTANQAPGPGGSSTWIAAAGIHTVLASVDIPYIRITEINKSNNSLSNTITVTATPPAFAIGDRVKTTANLNVYATPSTSGTIVGAQSVGSFGNVIGGPISANGFVWWNIDYDVGATGWSVQHFHAKVNPIPTVTLVANPTSITSGGSSTLTWSSTNATSCTGTGFTAGGTSGIATVSPTTVPQTYSITCTGTGGTGAPATATITAAVPDLIVTNISISPADPASGEAVTFTATTKNQGTAATPSGVSIGVTFFIDGNPVSASDNNIISLAPGASVNLTANQAPGPGGSSTWIAAAGIHTVLAAADIPYIRITEINKSNNSLSNIITVTATPPAFAIGDRVKTTANLNVYATPSTSGTIVGAQSVGSFGNVIGGPISANGFVWWNIDYDVGATGWSVQHYQAKVNPIPTVTLVANPTSITPGGSSTLTWSSTNATSCTGTGFTAGGTSGIATVSPTTVPQTYSITCTGTGGTGAPATATITAAVPDLIVTNISISPADPASGEAVTFTATTKNQGTAATPSGVSIGVTFFIDGNPVSASDNNIISLAPGASVNLTANQAPGPGGSSTWIAAAGIHTVLAAADIPYIRITEINKSNNSLSNTITVTATPPAFAIGDRVKTTANLNVYATPSTSGTIVGAQSVGSFGNVIGGPISANGFIWWNIDYDVGATGWSVQDYQAKVNPIPTVTLVANPTSITPGGSSTLTWSSTNATSCTGTGFTAGGTSGIATVAPTVHQTYSITCTGTGGTGAPATATITVSATLAALHCPDGGFSGLTLTDGTMNDLKESCTINGNLVIGGTGIAASQLNIGQSIVLTIVGDVILSGSGTLSVNGGTLALANQFNLQWSINAADDANISMLNGHVTTNPLATNQLTSIIKASDRAHLQVLNSTLSSDHNALLAVLGDSSSLTSSNSTVPTEIYLNGANLVHISGHQTKQGVHLNFPSGTSGSLTLPNTSTFYTWSVGSSTGLQVGWNLVVTDANPGLGIESHANSNWTITGANSGQKEVTISLHLDPPTAPTSLVESERPSTRDRRSRYAVFLHVPLEQSAAVNA